VIETPANLFATSSKDAAAVRHRVAVQVTVHIHERMFS
jgi:hypothetical protein